VLGRLRRWLGLRWLLRCVLGIRQHADLLLCLLQLRLKPANAPSKVQGLVLESSVFFNQGQGHTVTRGTAGALSASGGALSTVFYLLNFRSDMLMQSLNGSLISGRPSATGGNLSTYGGGPSAVLSRDDDAPFKAVGCNQLERAEFAAVNAPSNRGFTKPKILSCFTNGERLLVWCLLLHGA
jgi:hypothetical protein